MKKKIGIILIVIAILLCGVGGVLLFTANDNDSGKEKDTVSKEEDPNYIDRSEFQNHKHPKH